MKRQYHTIKKPKSKNIRKIGMLILINTWMLFTGCEDFLEIDFPNAQLTADEVFEDEETTKAAVAAMYIKLREEVLLTGVSTGLSVSMGLYADELDYYGAPGEGLDTFHKHTVVPSQNIITTLWNNSYALIYRANAIVEGIENSSTLTSEAANQFKGEALFIRALTHFYLVNLFGDIPYITTTDYIINSQVSRIDESEVYDAIIADLQQARLLVSGTYTSTERIQPNKAVVTALLAKVYLYTGQWALAEAESTTLINNTAEYPWETDLNKIFSKESTTTIWQLKPQSQGANTYEGSSFIFVTAPPPFIALREEVAAAFEPNDLRRVFWIGEVTDGNNIYYHSYKYKQNTTTGTSVEYSIIFRMAEQYLIRAEARIQLGNVIGTQQDLNHIRHRAGLPDITAANPEQLLMAIEKERLAELFTEHGHRWFDLKRTGRANTILLPLKPGWQSSNVLLPIPESELLLNPNLLPQNPGY